MLIWLSGAFLGFFVLGYLRALIEYLYGKLKGYSFFGLTHLFLFWKKDLYSETYPGKIRFSTCRISHLTPHVDMFRADATEEDLNNHNMVLFFIWFLCGMATGIPARVFFQGDYSISANFAAGILTGLTFVFLFGILSVNYGWRSQRIPLSGKTRSIRLLLQNRNLLLETPMPEFAVGEFGKASILEKIDYAVRYYQLAEIKNELTAMSLCASSMERLISPGLKPDLRSRLDSELFSFYSFRCKDPQKAMKHYRSSKKEIDSSMNPNGRRKLAYYALYILSDKEAARAFVEQGFHGLAVEDPRIFPVVNENEEKMLSYIKSVLEER